jgi:hypothetical protein
MRLAAFGFKGERQLLAQSGHSPNAHVRKVPEPDSCTAANGIGRYNNLFDHLVGARSDSAIISPIAFAVFRLAGEQRQTLG